MSGVRARSFQSTPSGGKATGEIALIGANAGRSFQSTPSGGKATERSETPRRRRRGFNPRLPGGRRLFFSISLYYCLEVSIHAFRGEGDGGVEVEPHTVLTFQSTPSGGKATVRRPRCPATRTVSIHAFRGEGDHSCPGLRAQWLCFNPRLPGGRRRVRDAPGDCRIAVSIHAFRGEGDAPRASRSQAAQGVSIHAFRGEGDSVWPALPPAHKPFQSTPSGGKATFPSEGLYTYG